MSKKPAHQWWVHSTCAGNEVIADYLLQQGLAEAEVLAVDVVCADGMRRNLWRIAGHHVKQFMVARRQLPWAHLDVYVQQHAGSAPKRADWLGRRRRKPAKCAKAAMVHG